MKGCSTSPGHTVASFHHKYSVSSPWDVRASGPDACAWTSCRASSRARRTPGRSSQVWAWRWSSVHAPRSTPSRNTPTPSTPRRPSRSCGPSPNCPRPPGRTRNSAQPCVPGHCPTNTRSTAPWWGSNPSRRPPPNPSSPRHRRPHRPRRPQNVLRACSVACSAEVTEGSQGRGGNDRVCSGVHTPQSVHGTVDDLLVPEFGQRTRVVTTVETEKDGAAEGPIPVDPPGPQARVLGVTPLQDVCFGVPEHFGKPQPELVEQPHAEDLHGVLFVLRQFRQEPDPAGLQDPQRHRDHAVLAPDPSTVVEDGGGALCVMVHLGDHGAGTHGQLPPQVPYQLFMAVDQQQVIAVSADTFLIGGHGQLVGLGAVFLGVDGVGRVLQGGRGLLGQSHGDRCGVGGVDLVQPLGALFQLPKTLRNAA